MGTQSDYSIAQNFYKNYKKLREYAEELFPEGFQGAAVEIGAGSGKIAKIVQQYVPRLVLYEPDENYVEILRGIGEEVELRSVEFKKGQRPDFKYSSLSNLPFDKTTEIMDLLLSRNSNLEEGIFFIQFEAALRYTGDRETTLKSVLSSIHYDLEFIEMLDPRDFKPIPSVDIASIKAVRRGKIEEQDLELLTDFVYYIFGNSIDLRKAMKKLFTFKQFGFIQKNITKKGWNQVSDFEISYFFELFSHFSKNGDKYHKVVKGSATKFKKLKPSN